MMNTVRAGMEIRPFSVTAVSTPLLVPRQVIHLLRELPSE